MTWELDLFNHDFFIYFFLQDVEEGTDRGSVGFSVFRVVSPSSQGECGCRGSTTLPQHAQCSLCFVYSCQPTESLLPIMYSRQCCCFFFLLFNVCSLSPWLVLLWIGFWKAAVFHIIVFSVCLVCFRCHLPARSRVTGGCASRQLSSVSVVCEVNVMVTVIRRKQSDDRNVKKPVFVWLVYVCLPVCAALWATYVRVWDAGQLLLVSECLFIIKRGLNFTQDVNR